MGDLGFVDESGYLHVVGRVKDIIIRGGTNINPYEVESMLRGHPRIVDACVVARPDAELGELPVAFLVTKDGFVPSREELDAFLEAQGLARYKWPADVRLLNELPLSGPGKVNRKALREDARAV
jgi:acyl-CoA synthetase (AMP-forming)/AMP-acid ligase II